MFGDLNDDERALCEAISDAIGGALTRNVRMVPVMMFLGFLAGEVIAELPEEDREDAFALVGAAVHGGMTETIEDMMGGWETAGTA